MFRTVRNRFLSATDERGISSLDELNMRYFKWLEEDYTRKVHSSLGGMSPHDALMSQVSRLKLVSDTKVVDEIFLYRVSRKIAHDATLQLESVLYETDPALAGKRLEIRYEPDWVGNENKVLPIYDNGKKIGGAHMIRFHDNAHAKRKDIKNLKRDTVSAHTISFSKMMKGE
jgi:hypothetical protein